MPDFTRGIIELQRRIYAQTGRRTDAYYKEGYGALFVYEGDQLTPQNVIHRADELHLALLNF
ncbi:hypothetical protein [Bacillus sp. 03113]|uniref:hypothetical protein n=1 Tax=Bacillus sp. 03113 TaxID=2578211 RepID=UPI0011445EA4|nr:hypothetical protein [Bacillus sp. 03113]